MTLRFLGDIEGTLFPYLGRIIQNVAYGLRRIYLKGEGPRKPSIACRAPRAPPQGARHTGNSILTLDPPSAYQRPCSAALRLSSDLDGHGDYAQKRNGRSILPRPLLCLADLSAKASTTPTRGSAHPRSRCRSRSARYPRRPPLRGRDPCQPRTVHGQ
jgi:hypothetical protein